MLPTKNFAMRSAAASSRGLGEATPGPPPDPHSPPPPRRDGWAAFYTFKLNLFKTIIVLVCVRRSPASAPAHQPPPTLVPCRVCS